LIRNISRGVAVLCMAGTAGCAIRLGGSKPEEYRTLALQPPAEATVADIARVVHETNASIVLLTAQRDSAWFGDVAAQTGLALSGPGTTESNAKAFFTNLKVLGDTSIVLGVADGTRMHMHDALYEIDKTRQLDLMLIGISPRSDLREAVRTLLSYIATDVGATAAIMMAIDAPTPQAGDSIATLLRAAYSNAGECDRTSDSGGASSVRLFYGPSARVQCKTARRLTDGGSPILADLIVGR
jgi:hypothetical protein